MQIRLRSTSAPFIAAAFLLGCSSSPSGNGPGAAGAPACTLGGASGGAGAGGGAGTGAVACQSNPADYAYPFQDPCGPLEDRITNLLSLLTSDEKQSLLLQEQPTIPRLGIPAFTSWMEGLHGVGWCDTASGSSVKYLTGTQFPQAFGLAESWDPAAMKTVGVTTGYETRVYNAQGLTDTGRGTALVVRAPLIDLGRDPRWGRTEESWGEDPYLTGELAKGFIAGLQGDDPKYLLTAGMVKHWLANNNEVNRSTSSSNLGDQLLHEYYSAPFATALREGHAQALMTAYNKIDGTPSAVSPLIKSLLVDTWGWDGFVSTDATAAQNLVAKQSYYPDLTTAVAGIIQAGTSILVQASIQTPIASAYMMGLVTDADLDAVLRPFLRVRFRLGDLDPPSYVPYKAIAGTETPWTGDEYKARALDVTRKTVVLLKNSGAALPLDASKIGSVAVIGPRADSVVRDWYGGLPPYTVTPRQGIANKLPAATINYAADDTGGAATMAAAMSDVALVFVGNHPTCSTTSYGVCPSPYEGRETIDRMSIILDPAQATLVQSVAAANPKTIVVLVSSYPIGIGSITDSVPAIVHVSNSSQELGTAIADVLFGDYNPAGRTSMTWYASETDIKTDIMDYDIRKGTTYLYFGGTPLYPFGYGGSYTTFSYANLTLSTPAVSLAAAGTPCGSVQVGVDVTNSGARDGDEVVQLYVAFPGSSSSLQRPLKQLRGFRRVSIAAGQTQHVSFDVAASAFTYWDVTAGAFAIEAGVPAEIQVGASSADIRLHATLNVTP